jgi:glycerol uptake facilitator protein
MNHFLGEFIGTAILIILGNGVVANVVLNQTKGNNGGWIVITFGWAIAVFTGVFASVALGGGGHLNPAVTVGLAIFSDFQSEMIPAYVGGQMAGAFAGAVVVWLTYKKHFDVTTDPELIRAAFCTSPAIRHTFYNLLTEVIGTFILVLGALLVSKPPMSLGTLDALPVALLVLGIGLSLGGPTGYAINPARDLGPRIAHFFLPIPNKKSSDWKYSWIPVVGPFVGGMLAAWVYALVKL